MMANPMNIFKGSLKDLQNDSAERVLEKINYNRNRRYSVSFFTITFFLSELIFFDMPKPSKRRSKVQNALAKRWSSTESSSSSASSNEEYKMDTEDLEVAFLRKDSFKRHW